MSAALKHVQLEGGKGLMTKDRDLVVDLTVTKGVVLLLSSKAQVAGGVIHFLPSDDAVSARVSRLVELVGGTRAVEARIFGKTPATFQSVREALHSHGVSVLGESCEPTGQTRQVRARPVEGKLSVGHAAHEVSGHINSEKSDMKEKVLGPSIGPHLSVVAATPRDREQERVRVLIVDDSKSIRQILHQQILKDPRLELVGEAASAKEADKLIASLKPDVLTLDIHMPEEDGVSFLRRLMKRAPMPVVVVTSLDIEESEPVLEALSLGALDCVQKPSLDKLAEIGKLMCEKLVVAGRHSQLHSYEQDVKGHAPRATSAVKERSGPYKAELIAIGSSTGGIQTLDAFFRALPDNIPPIVIVQHIPPGFSAAFARRANSICPFEVKEAGKGDAILPNRILIAPGGLHMEVVRRGGELKVNVFDGERQSLHKPSVNVLFSSVAREVGAKAIGVMMTGMGDDGAKGMLEMRQKGAITFAQSEESCVVFGMPKVAIEIGAAMHVVHRVHLPAEILAAARK